MRILVSEYLCGGRWPEADFPESLVKEGRAMLLSLIDDFARIPGAMVSATWDSRLPIPERLKRADVEMHVVHSAEEEQRVVTNLAQQSDWTCIVAPEFDSILEQTCRRLTAGGAKLVNCNPDAIRSCADKFEIDQLCRCLGVPTIQTELASASFPAFPCVVKLRDGAGSNEMELISTVEEWTAWSRQADPSRFIVQPHIQGTACSVAALFDHGTLSVLLPVTRQLITSDGKFRYCGGEIPLAGLNRVQLKDRIEQLAEQIPGLHGYVGLDFLIESSTGQVLLVEINPRLTTSYVGYRQLTNDNLAEWLLNPGRQAQPEFTGAVRFSSDGTILERSP